MWILVLTIISLSALPVFGAPNMLVGGLGNENEEVGDDDPVQSVVGNLTSEIKTAVTSKFSGLSLGSEENSVDPITVLSYKTQVVAGVNYFVKAKVGNKYFFLLRIYKDLGGNLELSNIKGPIKETDPIEYF